jgi:RNA polymerase sigma-70 factor (ECF subfamily)
MISPSDEQARFDALYRATRRDLLAYLVRRVPDREQAADLLAETYLIAWRRLHRIPHGDQSRLWLFGVARNLLRADARRRRVADELVARLGAQLNTATRPEPYADDRRTETLRRGLTDLADAEREALLLTAWEGFTPREIAAITASSANVVRVRLARARRKLRRRLSQPDPDPADASHRAAVHSVDVRRQESVRTGEPYRDTA